MPSKPELRQAMWSVYQHAFFRPGLRASVLPETVRPISLVQALVVLLASSDAHDYSRRERALRKLAAAGLTDRRRLARLAGAELAADILARVETLAQLVGVDEIGRASCR